MCTWAVIVGAGKHLELLPQVSANLTCFWLLTGIFEETDCSEAGNHWHNCRPSIPLINHLSYYGLCRSKDGTSKLRDWRTILYLNILITPTRASATIHSLLFLARWLSRLRHCATSRKVAGSIFGWYNPSGRTMALVSTQPGIFPEGKGDRGVGVTALPLSCADCHQIWDLQPPGTLRA